MGDETGRKGVGGVGGVGRWEVEGWGGGSKL